MVIGSEDIDQVVVTPLPLSQVVGDIGGEVSPFAIIANHHAIFLVAIVSCAEPGCAVFFIQHAPLFEDGQRVVDQIVVRQALLREPAVEYHTELGEIVLDLIEDRFERLLTDLIEAIAEQLLRILDQAAYLRFFILAI